MESFGDVRGKVTSLKKAFDRIRALEQPLPREQLFEKTKTFYDKLLSSTEGQHLSSPLDPTEQNNFYEFSKDGLTYAVYLEPFYSCISDENDPKYGTQTMRVEVKDSSRAIQETIEVVNAQNSQKFEKSSFTYERYVKKRKGYKKITEKNTLGAWNKILRVLDKMPEPIILGEPIETLEVKAS